MKWRFELVRMQWELTDFTLDSLGEEDEEEITKWEEES